jgi:hypothetical protein
LIIEIEREIEGDAVQKFKDLIDAVGRKISTELMVGNFDPKSISEDKAVMILYLLLKDAKISME